MEGWVFFVILFVITLYFIFFNEKSVSDYSNHPTLKYQRKASRGTVPAVLGDPIRPYPSSGPSLIGVPVPQGSLKLSNERTGYPFHSQRRPLAPADYFKPYGLNSDLSRDVIVTDTPFYRGYISSASSYSPFPEVSSRWEKIGMLQTTDRMDDTILNLYRRPIAPLQDLFEYSVQDKDGFIIPLRETKYLEDGDIIKNIRGKESKGSWKVNNFVKNKWIIG